MPLTTKYSNWSGDLGGILYPIYRNTHGQQATNKFLSNISFKWSVSADYRKEKGQSMSLSIIIVFIAC